MGGYGSGRWGWYNRKNTVEECLTLDGYYLLRHGFRDMKRSGLNSTYGDLRWLRGEREIASLGYQIVRYDDRVVLTLRYSVSGKSVEEEIRLQSTEQPQGGALRYWLSCPFCQRRSAKLYLPSGHHHFGCRQCHRLTYESCQESHRFDAMFRALAADMSKPCDWKEIRDLLNGKY